MLAKSIAEIADDPLILNTADPSEARTIWPLSIHPGRGGAGNGGAAAEDTRSIGNGLMMPAGSARWRAGLSRRSGGLPDSS
ncbi:MAG: hypothetical protein ACRDOH_33625 [Streptosporangiaceae bacterium]